MTPSDIRSETGVRSGLLVTSLIGISLSFGMAIGSLAPWVHLSRITISGWAGVGIPVVWAAFGAMGLHALHLFWPKRWILVSTGLIGVVGIFVAAIVSLLIWGLSGVKGLLISLLARGAHRQEFNQAGHLSLGWGIAVLAFCAFGLTLLSFAALAGKFSGSLARVTLGRSRRGEPTSWDTAQTLSAADAGIDELEGATGLDRYR